jgi:aminopeptidase N
MFSNGANERFAHELAHQYFGHAVRMPRVEDNWLQEATAEYMAAYFVGRAMGEKKFNFTVKFWHNRSKASVQAASPYAAALLDGHDAGQFWWDLTYNKGPWILHVMRQQMGDNAFFTILRSFIKSFSRQTATTQDFIGLANFVTKQDWQPFFDRYVYGTELPELP